MKIQQLNEMKKQDEKAILEKVVGLKREITEWVMDKKMNKLKDLKQIKKNRRTIAQLLTIVHQKQMLAELESLKSPELEKVQESEQTAMKGKN